MRSLIMVLCVALASQSFGQEVFRAMPIDDIQDARLDVNDERLARLERTVESLARSVEKLTNQQSVGKPVVQMASIQRQPERIVQQQSQYSGYMLPLNPQPSFQSSYYSTEELRQQIHSNRPGLQTYADDAYMARGSNVYNHLIGSPHGFTADQVNGLSPAEANVLHALAPGHKNVIFPRRSNQVQQVSQPVHNVVRVQPMAQPVMPNCALTGTCNLQQGQSQQVRYSRRGGGLLGFGILGG